MNNTQSTNTQSTTNTQLEQAKEVLLELAPNVTTDDRKAAEKKLKLSRFTISGYLKGDPKDLDTAMKLIEFLQPRIEHRNKLLKKKVA